MNSQVKYKRRERAGKAGAVADVDIVVLFQAALAFDYINQAPRLILFRSTLFYVDILCYSLSVGS